MKEYYGEGKFINKIRQYLHSKECIEWVEKELDIEGLVVDPYCTGEGVSLMEKDDLIKALKSKKIKHAALDVIQKEQQSDIANHKLVKYSKKHKNLTITPHVAGLTYESEYIAANIIYKKLINIAK